VKKLKRLKASKRTVIQRSYIDSKVGGQVHLAETGCGQPILLIHQTPRSWDEYREVMELMGSQFKMVAMDLPGMGGSTSAPDKPTIEFYAAAAAEVIEYISDGPVTVCGHHTGAAVAMEIAASRPELVNSLVLSSAPWVDAKDRAERAGKVPIDTVMTVCDGRHLIDLWNQRAPYYRERGDLLNRFIADALLADNPAAGHHAVANYHMEKAAPSVNCPVLLIEHSQDPFAVKNSDRLKAAFPQAVERQIPNGQIALEATAEEFARLLQVWAQEQIRTLQ